MAAHTPVVGICHDCCVGWRVQTNEPGSTFRSGTSMSGLCSLQWHACFQMPVRPRLAEGLKLAVSIECGTSRLQQSSVGRYWDGQGRQTFCAAWPRNELGKPDTPAFSVMTFLKAAVESNRLLEKLVAKALSCMLMSLKRLVASTLASSLLLPAGAAAWNQRSSLWCHSRR